MTRYNSKTHQTRLAIVAALEARRLLSTGPIDPDPSDLHGGHGSSDYQIGSRWTQTATDGNTGAIGSPITLTWGLVADGLSIPGSNGEPTSNSVLQTRLNSLYGSSAVWLPLFQSVFDRWSAITGITYIYTGLSDDGATFGTSPGVLGARPDVRIGGHPIDGASNTLAYNRFPTDGGDMVIDTGEFTGLGALTSTTSNSRALRNVVAHEHGHGLGLAHVLPQNNTKLMEPNLATNFDGPQFDDILAGQSLYGDPLEKGGRNDTAATATDLGSPGVVSSLNLTPWATKPVSIADSSDSDFFRFTIPADRTVSFSAAPFGTSYAQGPQGGSTATFNPAAQGNLVLTLLAANGTTVLRTANATGVGGTESINTVYLTAGTYFVKVGITSGNTQPYQLSTTISDTVLAAPSEPQLDASSDSGISNSDRITNDKTPTLFGTSTPNTTVTLLDGTTTLGTASVAGNGSWSFTTPTLADGVHSFTAVPSSSTAAGPSSTALSVTIDTVGIAVQATTYDRLATQDVRLVLNTAPAFFTSSGMVWKNVTTNTTLPIDHVTVTGGTTVNVQIDALLENGNYLLTVPTSAFLDVAGNGLTTPASFTFRQLNGDADNNGVVDFTDLLTLAQSYGQFGKSYIQGNYDYSPDGLVGFDDLLIVAQNYNLTLFAAEPIELPPTPKSGSPASRRRSGSADLLS